MSRWTRFWHLTMGWHPSRYWRRVDDTGLSSRFRCQRCDYVGMVDSQGNLF